MTNHDNRHNQRPYHAYRPQEPYQQGFADRTQDYDGLDDLKDFEEEEDVMAGAADWEDENYYGRPDHEGYGAGQHRRGQERPADDRYATHPPANRDVDMNRGYSGSDIYDYGNGSRQVSTGQRRLREDEIPQTTGNRQSYGYEDDGRYRTRRY